MIQEIKMPAAGQTTNKATIAKVMVKVGDTVKRGDVLLEAETDKAVLPVESYAAGDILAILVEDGDRVTAGDVLMAIGKKGEVYEKAGAKSPVAAKPVEAEKPVEVEEEYLPIIKGAKPASVAAPLPAKAPVAAAVYPAMPGAKMLAKELGIDIATVVPQNGALIKRADVKRAFDAAKESAQAEKAVSKEAAEYDVMPMTRMRTIIGTRMLESVHNIPAFQCTVSIDMAKCMELRKTYQDTCGIKVSYNDILAKAVAVASANYPLVRARYEEGEIRIYRHMNIGLAVGLDGALIVPVAKSIDQKGLEEIAGEYKALVQKAREQRLLPNEMGCGSMTISNLGMYEIEQFTAIINPPESGILAVGKVEMQPVWNGQEFLPVPKMKMTGSFDHRIMDGAYGAQFMKELKLLMENPTLLLR
ncbi:MAG: 2-oxo acid dehydrogenase subunit E2 [Lachnospiraceae bacterium]|nr:2-oxo acid dehydrogenase subunit E2 [Lachnospiraceae bacterium]